MKSNERVKALNEELEILLDGIDDKDFIKSMRDKLINYNSDYVLYDKLLNLGMALVELGADINIQGKKNGKTLLMLASQRLNGRAVKNLIKYGADINKRDSENRSALQLALMNNNDTRQSISVIPFLGSGETPEYTALEAVSELISHGADKSFLDEDSSREIYYRLSKEIGEVLCFDDFSNYKELALKNFEKMIKLLGKDFVLKGDCFAQQIRAMIAEVSYHCPRGDLEEIGDFLIDILTILKNNGAKIGDPVYSGNPDDKNIFYSVARMPKAYRNRVANFLLQNGVRPDKIVYNETSFNPWNLLDNISDNLDTLKACVENNLISTKKPISKRRKKLYLKEHSKEEKKLIGQIIDQANADFEKKSDAPTQNL